MRQIELGKLRMAVWFCLHPRLFAALTRLPKVRAGDTTTTLDEWLIMDNGQTDIFVQIFGCKCPQTFKEQQRENMAVRKKVARTFGEWTGLKGHEKETCRKELRGITVQYEKRQQCHRTYGTATISVRCYCDEHTH